MCLLISLKESVPCFITQSLVDTVSTRLSSAIYDNCTKYSSSQTSLKFCSKTVIRIESPPHIRNWLQRNKLPQIFNSSTSKYSLIYEKGTDCTSILHFLS